MNLENVYNQDVLAQTTLRPVQFELDEVPTSEELESALQKMKLGKVGGKTGILSKRIAFGGGELRKRLQQIISMVWQQQAVVSDWRNAKLPYPKEGKSSSL